MLRRIGRSRSDRDAATGWTRRHADEPLQQRNDAARLWLRLDCAHCVVDQLLWTDRFAMSGLFCSQTLHCRLVAVFVTLYVTPSTWRQSGCGGERGGWRRCSRRPRRTIAQDGGRVKKTAAPRKQKNKGAPFPSHTSMHGVKIISFYIMQ